MSRKSARIQFHSRRSSRRLKGLSPKCSPSPPSCINGPKRAKSNTFSFNFTLSDEQTKNVETEDFYKKITVNLDKGPEKFQGVYSLDTKYHGKKHGNRNYGEPVLTIVSAKICGLPRILQLHSHKWSGTYWAWYSPLCSQLPILHELGEVIYAFDSFFEISWTPTPKQLYILNGHEDECCLFGAKEIVINEDKNVEYKTNKEIFFYGRIIYCVIAGANLEYKDKVIEILYKMNQLKNAINFENVMKSATKLLKPEKYGIHGSVYEPLGQMAWNEQLVHRLEKCPQIELKKNKCGRFVFDIKCTVDDDNNIKYSPDFFKEYFVKKDMRLKVTNFGAEITFDYNPKNGKVRIKFALLQMEHGRDGIVHGQDVLTNDLFVKNVTN